MKYIPSSQKRSCKSAPRAPRPRASRAPAGRKLFGLVFVPALSLSLYLGGGRALSHLNVPAPPEPQPAAGSSPGDAEWQTMSASLEAMARGYRGRVGIYIKDLNTGKVWEHNPDTLFTSASLIKVPIMVSVCEKIKSGALSLDTRLKLTRQNRVGGSGSLKWAREGTSLSVMEVVYKMITESDNTATRMLLDNSGIDYFQRAFSGLGLVSTRIYPEGMSLAARGITRENYTTAREMAGLLESIYRGQAVDKESSEFMMEVLKHNKSRSRLKKGLPPGWELGHKTGLLRRSCHDVGIVFSPRGDYVIAVLTGDVPDYGSAKEFITRVAGQTYRYYRPGPDYAASRASGPAARAI